MIINVFFFFFLEVTQFDHLKGENEKQIINIKKKKRSISTTGYERALAYIISLIFQRYGFNPLHIVTVTYTKEYWRIDLLAFPRGFAGVNSIHHG